MLIELAPLLSAFLMWAAFPPLGWGVLAVVAPTPLLAALRRVPTRRGAAALGFAYGAVFYSLLLFWVKETGFLSVIALVLLLSSYSAIYAVLVYGARDWARTAWWLTAVGAWALIELVRLYLPFGGFSWGLLGYPAGEYEWTRGATQFIGTTGWSVVFVAIAAGLALFVTDRRRPSGWLVSSLAVGALLAVAGALAPPSADGEALRVAIIQGNSPCPGVRCVNENRLIFESHLELTRSLTPGQARLVVWPESSAGSSVELVTHPDRLTQVAGEARRLDAWFLIGSQRTIDDESFTNLNVVIDADGRVVGEYWKRHPVPFGEYVPLRPLFDWIPALDQVPRDLVRGTEDTVFELPEGTLGSIISFEGAFPRSTRPLVRGGAELLVVATNKASFGDTPVSDQFIGMTSMRAAELGTPVVHAAITGRSAFIAADGTIQSRTEAFEADILLGTVNYRTAGMTLYARFGDWLQYLAVAAGAAVLAAGWLHRQREKAVAAAETEVDA
ncbi:MAG: apolipoprotein N-acyltransferase [Acidimicrobiia bacterium]|nr:apolipoprotein N-acyltransferase [Acidimicrobiia bacterium]